MRIAGRLWMESMYRAGLSLVCVLASAGCGHAQNSGTERDRWQHPDEVLDALAVKAGTVVADIGCGKGYFTMKFAERVGPSGKVYAEDLKDDALADVRREADSSGFKQIQTILGTDTDPRLPSASLDVAFAMDTYHEWVHNDAMLDQIYLALKPGGLFGVIDGATETGKSRDDYHSMHRMPESMERQDILRHHFQFVRLGPAFTRPSDGKTYYFLIFQK